ncbi:phosphomevalonate kinase [Alkalispirochaeta americana]|uniref:phosphomevalonate kinase n=1 Tax=Alkalispirochaeta americana TaxID=159291 RepID=A0A1N6SFF0_9SPIO|nr:hypothetical protein [Alkalispirochaeta americana]SIQ39791.1 phosphomevalonate kinase [Alkalispirochaeta americana]
MTYSVPASLLLAGEYAVTRPGGEGLALAVSPRAWVSLQGDLSSRGRAAFRRDLFRERPCLGVQALQGSAGTSHWPDDPLPVVQPVLTALTEILPRDIPDQNPPEDQPPQPGTPPRKKDPLWTITIDTSRFFSARGGLKQGLGSSAAATVLLTVAVLHLIGLDPLRNKPLLFRIAHRAHRLLQGGRGSGYDLACSITGGTIHFTGGDPPEWTPLELHTQWAATGLSLFSSTSGTPVKSSAAVEAFNKAFPPGSGIDNHALKRFLKRNNAVVEALRQATSSEELFSALARAREISRHLGEQIGVPAAAPIPSPGSHWQAKTSGAGDEQIIIFATGSSREGAPEDYPGESTSLTVEPLGLIREEHP